MKKFYCIAMMVLAMLLAFGLTAFAAEEVYYAQVMSYSGPTSGDGLFIGTSQNTETGNENGAPCIVGTTVSEMGGAIWKNRVGYIEFEMDTPSGEFESASLKLYLTTVNENLVGWMKLAAYQTLGKPEKVALGQDTSAAGYGAIDNDYSYSAAFWSDEIYPSSANTWKTIDVTEAVKKAMEEQSGLDKIKVAFRLQVPKAGVNISVSSTNKPTLVIKDDSEEIVEEEYTRKGLFTHNMLSDNPGEVGFTSLYEHGDFMTERGYDGMTFSLFEAAQYGLLWDEYDKSRGITLTKEEYLANPNDSSIKAENSKKVFPYGSVEREWVEKKRSEIIKMYSDAQKAGQKIYFMQDVIVLPVKLKNDRPDINTDGKIDIRLEATREVMDFMYEEMFNDFLNEDGERLLDGIYVRYGETYTGSRWGMPYHTGNNPIMGNSTETHLLLMNYLRDKVCIELNGEIIYRTWGFGAFQYDKDTYLSISNQLEPHENFYFAIKHTSGDFHRTFTFNQSLNTGKHKQIVEVQCAREYEGKGAYPNYIAGGVINGFEEYSFLMNEYENQSLRDVINVEDSLVVGIWTWARGGGWAGPYINGLGHDSDKSIPVPNGSEMWCDLNSYVINKWAKDTSRSDKELVIEYAKLYLNMNDADAENFYEICEKSSKAVLLGRARNTDKYNVDVWWTRDDGIKTSAFRNNVKNAYDNGAEDIMLEEKAQAVALWKEMMEIAKSLDDELYNTKLIDSETSVKDYIIMTTSYGYYLYDIYNQMHIAEVERLKAEERGVDATDEMVHAVLKYDLLWDNWQKEYEENKLKGYPTLYARESTSFAGYNSLVYCQPFSNAMDSFARFYGSKLSVEAVGVNCENADYALDSNINTAVNIAYASESEYSDKYVQFELAEPAKLGKIVIKKQKMTLIGNTTYWADHAYAVGCAVEASYDGEVWDTIHIMNTAPDGTDSTSEVVINLAEGKEYKYVRYIRKEKNNYISWAENGGNKLILAEIEFYVDDMDKVWISSVERDGEDIEITLDILEEHPSVMLCVTFYKEDTLIGFERQKVEADNALYNVKMHQDADSAKVMVLNMTKIRPSCEMKIVR